MGAFVIIATTLVPGNALHGVFIKVGLSWWTLWIAACNTIMTLSLTSVEIPVQQNGKLLHLYSAFIQSSLQFTSPSPIHYHTDGSELP